MATFKYQHLHSTSATTAPSADKLIDGEIALNIKKDNEAIYFKNTANEVVEFKVGDYYTKSETDGFISGLTDVDEAIDGKLTTHTGNSEIHVTANDKTNWNGKADKSYVDDELAKKADTATTYTKTEVDGKVSELNTEIAKKADKSYVDETFFADAKYETSGNTKVINFYAVSGETPLATIDATPFIKDGMISAVTIDEETSELVITWNTDASTTETRIALTKIFDPDNYYTIDDVDGIIEDVEGKITTVDGKVTAEETRATKKEGELATAIEEAKKVAITAATAAYDETTNVLNLTLTNGENASVKVDMKVTDAGNGLLVNSAKTEGTIILSGGTF